MSARPIAAEPCDTTAVLAIELPVDKPVAEDSAQRAAGAAFRRLEHARLETRGLVHARWIVDGIYRYLADSERGQAAELVRYLGLPRTPAIIRRGLRDQWLARAAAQIEAPSIWRGCEKLSKEWQAFVELAPWLNSKHAKAPPAEIISELRLCLWWASHFSDRTLRRGDTLCPRALWAISAVTEVFSARLCSD